MKHLKLFGDFLNEGAFHVALFKARNEGLKEFEFNGKTYPVKEKKVDENSNVQESFEVHYSDGVRGMQKFNDKSKAIAFMKDKIKNTKGLKDIAIYNAGSNFHSTADTDAVITWWGDGSYLDNVSKKDSNLASKKLNESILNEDWGSSDQATMNKAIHRDMGNPSRFPSPFDDKLRSAAADAVDFWWDEWPEYKRDREGLIDHAIRAYYRAYFPKEFAGFTKMFNESHETLNEATLSNQEANYLAHKMLNYAVDNGMIPASKKTKENVDGLTNALYAAKLDLKKDARGAAHKILNQLVDRGLIPVSKKTEDHVSKLASKLASVELNEAMVQVAGKNKPSGAKILATVIVDDLMKKDYLKPGADKVKSYLVDDIQDIIMNNTF
jgi:hypothetical protein